MQEGDAETLLRGPLEEIDLAQRRKAMEILEPLGINWYGPNEIEPDLER